MVVNNVQSIRRMIAQLRLTPEIQASIAQQELTVIRSALMVLDLNLRSQDYRHRVAAQWCEAMTCGRWRRRVVERHRHARLDRVYFDFEDQDDAAQFCDWLAERGW